MWLVIYVASTSIASCWRCFHDDGTTLNLYHELDIDSSSVLRSHNLTDDTNYTRVWEHSYAKLKTTKIHFWSSPSVKYTFNRINTMDPFFRPTISRFPLSTICNIYKLLLYVYSHLSRYFCPLTRFWIKNFICSMDIFCVRSAVYIVDSNPKLSTVILNSHIRHPIARQVISVRVLINRTIMRLGCIVYLSIYGAE